MDAEPGPQPGPPEVKPAPPPLADQPGSTAEQRAAGTAAEHSVNGLAVEQPCGTHAPSVVEEHPVSRPGLGHTPGERIASEMELERFARTSVGERQLTSSLRGVLAETALTGRVRYPWALLRPLIEFVLQEVCVAGWVGGAVFTVSLCHR